MKLDFDPGVEVERAWTPPASWYRDPELLELERRTVFGATWQVVGRADQVAEPGCYFAADVAGEPVVVVRDQQGTLRAFSNVCRHHAACVATGEGKASQLTCPYHGWAYRLDGSLKSAPRLGPARDFRREDFSLPSLSVECWGPLVFVHLGRPERPLQEELAPLEGRLWGMQDLKFVARRSYELACNWKVFVDNYLDGGYHVESIHPVLASNLDLGAYRTELFDTLSIQSCRGGSDQRVGGEAVYAFCHPNLMINRYGPWMDTNLVLPLGPEECVTVFDYYLETDRHDPEFIHTSLAASHQVQLEDVAICESVQRGLNSRFYDKGRYAPEVEHADHHFHCLLARVFAGEAAVPT